ncbi:MAG: hypothetical protein FWC61_04775 [Proteobacteria bacterium]|nr:hypothetical protein [Pseudomonadota bacterium]
MIDYTKTLSDAKSRLALSCWGEMDATELIKAADLAARENIPAVSAGPEYIHMLWSWLEKTKTEIFSRMDENRKPKTEDQDSLGARLSEKISATFKNGAGAVQLMVAREDLGAFVSALFPVKPDLFFGRKLFIGMDFNDIDYYDWENIFFQADKIGASGILLDAARPADAARRKPKEQNSDDTVGRLFGLFDSLPAGFSGKIQFAGLDMAGIEAAMRLCDKMRPETGKNLLFFIGKDFFKDDGQQL